MHKHKITHRDLKPENIIFISKDPTNLHIKVIDFGTSKKLKFKSEKMRSRMGTPYYIAPEVIEKFYGI